jgi:hypothetical protein
LPAGCAVTRQFQQRIEVHGEDGGAVHCRQLQMHLREWQIRKLSTSIKDAAQIFEKILPCAGIPNEVGSGLSPDRGVELLY